MTAPRLSVVVLAVFCLSSNAFAEDQKGKVVEQPDWLERPNSRILAEAYPKLASALDIEGRASISCKVTAEGTLINCNAVSESPAGLGFGEAAKGLAPTFRMKPKKIDGKSVDGGSVRIPIHFTLPREPPPSKTDSVGSEVFGPITPTALELGRKIVRAQDISNRSKVTFELYLMKMGSTRQAGLDEKLKDAGISALRAGFQKAEDEILEILAKGYAGAFSEVELKDIDAFLSSPSGKAFTTRSPMIYKSVGQRSMDLPATTTSAAHDIYCADHPCTSVPPPTLGTAAPRP